MPSPRLRAVEIASSRSKLKEQETKISSSEIFGKLVFNRQVMERMLPTEVFANLSKAILGKEKIKTEFADTIANAMKDWALEHGATHYTHWFQPLTGASAEKHDSFIVWEAPQSNDKVIERFSGKQLIQGEPDASSFPSGGLRSTYEARGYTGWDPTSPPFLWRGGDGYTLCIPSVFFSWTGEVLDTKLPLLRSDAKINQAVLRLLNLTGIEADHVFSTLGFEQEYFIIDKALKNIRPDLLILGKTVIGAPPPKGQELQDHYFGAVKDRVLAFMRDFENKALELGIPVKTRHNEVAPAQHEVAPVYERATVAVDHNIILMELMRQVASDRGLSVLLHEKPFHDLNGSGKHSNWSLSTDSGLNLLDPSDTPENNLHFLILLVAFIHAIWENNGLIRASIGTAPNDDRLGGHEAPPAIISIYLGQELEELLNNLEEKGVHDTVKGTSFFDLDLAVIPELTKDQTDRNRTSPIAFTGNKFELRAVGSSQNPAFPITVLNAIVSNSLNRIIDEIEHSNDLSQNNPKELLKVVLPVLQKYIKISKPVRFHGDNYSVSWVEEAKRRGLPNYPTAVLAYHTLKEPKTKSIFEKILNEKELQSRYEIMLEHYIAYRNIEAKLIIEMYRTQVLPAAMASLEGFASGISAYNEVFQNGSLDKQKSHLKKFAETIEAATVGVDELEALIQEFVPSMEEKADKYSTAIKAKYEEVRSFIDTLEANIDDELWPLPKYRELLWLV